MSRAASPGWKSSPGDLTKRQRATLRANWQELTEYLAAPGVAWEWDESGLSDRIKHYLRHHGLIVRVPDDTDCWQTTEALWIAMLEDASDDETIGGGAEGQCKLPQEAQASSTPSRAAGSGVHTTPTAGRGVNGARQATLDGGTVETVNDEDMDTALVEQNPSKGERDDPTERGDGQSPLSRWAGLDTGMDAWDVTADAGEMRLQPLSA